MNRKLYLGLVVVGCLLLVGCGQKRETIERGFVQSEQEVEYIEYNGEQCPVVYIGTDRTVYASFEEIKDAADCIVIGEFIGDTESTTEKDYSYYFEKDVTVNAYSWCDFRVDRVLKGDVDGETITIYSSYGYDDDSKQVLFFTDLTPMKKGDSWIYFLRRDEKDGKVRYWTVGSKDGRYPNKLIRRDVFEKEGYSAEELGVQKYWDFASSNIDIYEEMVDYYKLDFQ